MYRLLVVDDEENILRALRRTLSVDDGGAHQFNVEIFSSPAAALKRADEMKFDLVLSDYRMPEMVQSELGKGTAFKICLPISQSESLEAVAAVGLTLHK